MIQMPRGSRWRHSKCAGDHQCVGVAQQLAVTCMGECFPLQRRLWQAGQGSSRDGNSNHSLSSGFWGSKILTCVKGKSPLRPFTSPSHWPFIFILVTFTMSPTWRNRKDKISITVQTRKTVYIVSQMLSIQRLKLNFLFRVWTWKSSTTETQDTISIPRTPLRWQAFVKQLLSTKQPPLINGHAFMWSLINEHTWIC